MPDEIPAADRVWAVLRFVGVTPDEERLLRGEPLLDSEDREGPPVQGDTR